MCIGSVMPGVKLADKALGMVGLKTPASVIRDVIDGQDNRRKQVEMNSTLMTSRPTSAASSRTSLLGG